MKILLDLRTHSPTLYPMRLAWLTDIHLNFLSTAELGSFIERLSSTRTDAVVITGDIGEADSVAGYLRTIAASLQCPVYFVLGNHDYYRGTIEEVRGEMQTLVQEISRLHYLSSGEIHPLTAETCLVGHDGWPDGRNGDFENSSVLLNDFLLIRDFRRPDRSIPRMDPEVRRFWLSVMQRLADEATVQLERSLQKAVEHYPRIMLATHVPPFRESARFRGTISGPNFQPFFSSRTIGEMLVSFAARHPHTEFTVLCGHSHWAAEYSPLLNLTTLTGETDYGKPVIQRIFSL